MNNWKCTKCDRPYSAVPRKWRERGHCAVCEVASWSPEKLAETEALFNEAMPAIIKGLEAE